MIRPRWNVFRIRGPVLVMYVSCQVQDNSNRTRAGSPPPAEDQGRGGVTELQLLPLLLNLRTCWFSPSLPAKTPKCGTADSVCSVKGVSLAFSTVCPLLWLYENMKIHSDINYDS